MDRAHQLHRLASRADPWDMVVIGGGATGAGIALDAAARGYAVALLEQHDFGKGTSSRSTKLVHGGVRYLQQGNISLVMEALKERGLLLRNAPHLVRDLAFIVPNYDWWEAPFYGLGMKVYDLLAGRYGFGRSRLLSKDEVLRRIPTLEDDGLRGGVLYYDGQFDDARLLINLIQTAVEHGAAAVNYVRVTAITKDGRGLAAGVVAEDLESGRTLAVPARCVINAAGPFADAVRRMDEAGAPAMIAPSRGSHIVLDGSFLPGGVAIMVPRTRDGRVMFAIPWHGRAVVGTTDVAAPTADLEPRATDDEIEYILDTAGPYLERPPTRADIRSVFAGIRPLVRSAEAGSTAALSRDHTVQISPSGVVTIVGGKWTTYRKMAEDAVDHAATVADLDERPCPTRELPIHGACIATVDPADPLAGFGADRAAILDLTRSDPGLGSPLHPGLPITAAQVLWAARHEMARSVEDVLSRRTRCLLLDAAAAIDAAPAVASLLAAELRRDSRWAEAQTRAFADVALGYLPGPASATGEHPRS